MFFIPAASPKSSTWPVSANGNWKSHAEKHHISSHTQWLCYKQHGFWKTRKPFFSWMRNSWANDQNSTLLSEGLKMFEWLLGQYWSRFCCLGTESNAANELIEVWYVSFLFFEGSHRKGWFAIICLGQNCAETSTGTLAREGRALFFCFACYFESLNIPEISQILYPLVMNNSSPWKPSPCY